MMLKLISIFGLVVINLLATPAWAQIQLVATLPALGQIAQGIGGTYVDVRILAHPGQDPHFVPPKPTLARHLADADLLLAAGFSLESGWLPPLIEASRNPAIRPGSTGYIDGRQVIRTVLGKPQGNISRALGDIHPDGNPHWWLDPLNGVRLAYVLADRLSAIDHAHADEFKQNAALFETKVQTRMPDWQQHFSTLGPLVSYHDSYLYLAHQFSLHIVDFVEPKPGIEPSTAHLDALVKRLQQGEATAVWLEPYHDGKTVRRVCELGHVPCLIRPDVVTGKGFDAYLALFDTLAGIRK